MLFKTKAAAAQFIIRTPKPIHDHGVLVGEERGITATAAEFGDDFVFEDADGNTSRHPDIRGYMIDTDEMAERLELTPDEKALTEKRLLWFCDHFKAEIHLFSAPKPAPPWPTYEETHHKQVPALAEQLGLIHEAIAYEAARDNPRREVTERLEALLQEKAEEETLTAA